jgi:diacylglycerol kinase family enzyme
MQIQNLWIHSYIGDGLVHEVIATLLSLSPSCRVHIVAIPCGTGNALCHSLGTGTPQKAISRFLSNETRPLKLSAVYVKRLAGGPLELVRPCFCVFSWGYHAQVVRQSEVLRFLGVSRFRVRSCLLPQASSHSNNALCTSSPRFGISSASFHTLATLEHCPTRTWNPGSSSTF